MALRPRNALVLVVSLLLLGMQVEGQRHALTHLGGLLHRAHEQGVQQSVGDAPCIECELLASGSHLVASSIAALAHSGGAAELIARLALLTAGYRQHDRGHWRRKRTNG